MNTEKKKLYLDICHRLDFREKCIHYIKNILKKGLPEKSYCEIIQEAEDTYSEVYIKMNKQFDEGKLDRPINSTWFYNATFFLIRDKLKKFWKEKRISLDDNNFKEPSCSNVGVDNLQMGDFMAEFSKRLNQNEKEVFGSLALGKSFKDIAQEIGVLESTLKRKIVYNIEKKLKKYIEEKPGRS